MSYDVLVGELRAAAALHQGVIDGLGSQAVDLSGNDPTVLGHVELAAWLTAVADQCEKAHQALTDGQTSLADGLETAAADYESTDEAVGLDFLSPFTGEPLFPSMGNSSGSPTPGAER
ncbi:type VII secretion target [Nocardioides ferulae]|uniref:type VII secretion target n=1 Tax=Nocardioides ferulae TaxID=2340821 RepID=UPI000EAD0D26|nr:type VII secretion target [Nocardioides ferulae]